MSTPSKTNNSFPLKLNLWKVEHLALRLGYKENVLRYFISKRSENVNEIKLNQVRNGKQKIRTVYGTSDGYKKLLRKINKNILQTANFPDGILGGIIGKAIDDMANKHCGREALFSIDFKEFFPNIKSEMVRKFFRRAKCSKEVADILTDLVTFNEFLPQGFPTSTMMANLIAYDLDIKHLSIAKKYNLVRTRWIDDVVFSGRTAAIKEAIPIIIGTVSPLGFKINNKKTRFEPRGAKPIVTGLEVNHKSPRVPLVRIHAIERLLGICEKENPLIAQSIYESDSGRKVKDFRASLNGQITFVEKHDSKKGLVLRERMGAICW